MAAVSNISNTHPEYNTLKPLWGRMRDTIGGEDAVKAKTTLYLQPLNPSDVDDCGKNKTGSAYQIYLDNAAYYNAVGLTYEAFIGMIFRKPVRVEKPASDESIDTKEEPLLQNIDLEGTTIEVFSYDIAQEVAAVGRVGVLYDAPSIEDMGELTINEAELAGVRPYLKMYKAENIINWKFKNINGVRKLVAVVLQEEVEDEAGVMSDFFSHDVNVQYRALLIEDGKYVQRVFDETGNELEDQSNKNITINGEMLTEIPFVCINSSSIGLDTEKPPLLDLANTNLTHYRVSASLGACIHMFGRITPIYYVPAQHAVEFAKQTLAYGVGKSIIIPTAGDGAKAEATFLEPKSDFTGVVNEMVRLESRMAAQGARALRPQKSGVESAETVGLDMMSELSILGAIANNVSIGLTMGVTWLLGGSTDDITLVKLNTDFLTKPIDAAMFGQMMTAVEKGNMSQEQFTDAIIRGEAVLPDAEITTDTEFKAVEKEDSAMELAQLDALKTTTALLGGDKEEPEKEEKSED